MLFIIMKRPKTKSIIPLWIPYFMPQNPQNTISQISLKHYNKSIIVRTEALRWLQVTTDTGIKLKVETTVKEIDQ